MNQLEEALELIHRIVDDPLAKFDYALGMTIESIARKALKEHRKEQAEARQDTADSSQPNPERSSPNPTPSWIAKRFEEDE